VKTHLQLIIIIIIIIIHCVGRMLSSVRASQETHYVFATKPNRLMMFREIIAVYCENHTEHTNTLCGQNAEFSSCHTGNTLRLCYKAQPGNAV
jgi:flagellar basal body-associated protein FliL